jgi:hypothetical protein
MRQACAALVVLVGCYKPNVRWLDPDAGTDSSVNVQRDAESVDAAPRDAGLDSSSVDAGPYHACTTAWAEGECDGRSVTDELVVEDLGNIPSALAAGIAPDGSTTLALSLLAFADQGDLAVFCRAAGAPGYVAAMRLPGSLGLVVGESIAFADPSSATPTLVLTTRTDASVEISTVRLDHGATLEVASRVANQPYATQIAAAARGTEQLILWQDRSLLGTYLLTSRDQSWSPVRALEPPVDPVEAQDSVPLPRAAIGATSGVHVVYAAKTSSGYRGVYRPLARDGTGNGGRRIDGATHADPAPDQEVGYAIAAPSESAVIARLAATASELSVELVTFENASSQAVRTLVGTPFPASRSVGALPLELEADQTGAVTIVAPIPTTDELYDLVFLHRSSAQEEFQTEVIAHLEGLAEDAKVDLVLDAEGALHVFYLDSITVKHASIVL